MNIDPRRTMGRHELGAKHGMLRGDVKSHKNKTTQVHKKSLPNSKGEKENFLEDKGYARRGPRRRRVRGKRSTPESSLAEGVNKTTTSNEEEFIPQFLS